MSEKIWTAERVAKAIFGAQDRYLVPNPYDEASILDFVKDVGADVAARNFQNIMGMMSWGDFLDQVAEKLKKD